MFSNYYTKKQNKRKFSLNNWHENYMKIVEQAKKKLKSEKVDASFLYSLLLLCTSMCANACWYIHVRVNFVVFSTIFRKVAFLPLPYAPGSWKAACTFGSGPQAPVFYTDAQNKT